MNQTRRITPAFLWIGLVFAGWVAGCQTAPVLDHTDLAHTYIIKNRTTGEEVLSLFGSPRAKDWVDLGSGVVERRRQSEVWNYRWIERPKKSSFFQKIMGPLVGSADELTEMVSIDVTVDGEGTVRDYTVKVEPIVRT